jgi:hypothetical protein
MNESRVKSYLHEISKKFATKTIISACHRDAIILMTKQFTPFDYLTQKQDHDVANATPTTKYRDNDRNTSVDLHKPYIDNYWFSVD